MEITKKELESFKFFINHSYNVAKELKTIFQNM